MLPSARRGVDGRGRDTQHGGEGTTLSSVRHNVAEDAGRRFRTESEKAFRRKPPGMGGGLAKLTYLTTSPSTKGRIMLTKPDPASLPPVLPQGNPDQPGSTLSRSYEVCQGDSLS